MPVVVMNPEFLSPERRPTVILPLGYVPGITGPYTGAGSHSGIKIGYAAVSDSLLVAPRIPPDPFLPELDVSALPSAAPAAPAATPALPAPGIEQREAGGSSQRTLLCTLAGFASGLLLAWFCGLF
jgi:hypothetical protein